MNNNLVIWHPYPRTKPRESGEYLISVRYDAPPVRRRVTAEYYMARQPGPISGSFIYEQEMHTDPTTRRVIEAWAEMPDPYEEVDE